MNPEYSNREIDAKMEGVHEKLDLILEQTTEHNHRMSKIEQVQLEWKGGMKVVIAIVLPLMGWVLWQQYKFKDDVRVIVDDSIEEKLEGYNILYKASIE